MLIKEYRIPLPMTVEEYRIAQLYMIAKKSREESKVSFKILKLNCKLLVGISSIKSTELHIVSSLY